MKTALFLLSIVLTLTITSALRQKVKGVLPIPDKNQSVKGIVTKASGKGLFHVHQANQNQAGGKIFQMNKGGAVLPDTIIPNQNQAGGKIFQTNKGGAVLPVIPDQNQAGGKIFNSIFQAAQNQAGGKIFQAAQNQAGGKIFQTNKGGAAIPNQVIPVLPDQNQAGGKIFNSIFQASKGGDVIPDNVIPVVPSQNQGGKIFGAVPSQNQGGKIFGAVPSQNQGGKGVFQSSQFQQNIPVKHTLF